MTISPSPANLVAAIRPVTIPANEATAIIPFASSPTVILPSIFVVTASISIANPTPAIVVPAKAILSFPANLVAAIKPVTIPAR